MRTRKFKLNDKLTRNFGIEVKTIDKDKGTLTAIFSTQDEDRHGDTVMQEGWDLKSFKKNPVILNSHNYGSADEVIGKASNLRIEGKKLIGDITFAINENPKAKVIFDLYAGGFLNAFSVGFIVKKFKEDDYFVIEESELLEVSAVSVPANARALAKQKGIDTDVLPEVEGEPEHDSATCEAEDCEICDAEDDPEDPEGDTPTDPEPEPEAPVEPAADPEPEAEPESEPEVPVEEPVVPVVTSYKSRALIAIHTISARERKGMERAGAIIKRILEGNENAHLPKKTQEQIRKRMVNQAIRALYESK